MYLFFHDIGITPWQVLLFVFGVVSCPIFGGFGIYYLSRRMVKQSSYVVSFVALLVFFLFCYVTNLLPNTDISAFVYLTIPFGFAAAAFLGMTGLPFIAFLLGIVFNFLSILGLVCLVERFFGKKLK